MLDYNIGKLNGRFVLIWFEATGKRRRYRLNATDPRGAAIEAPGLFSILTRPQGKTVAVLWSAFVSDRRDRAIIVTMTYTWRALRERFGALPGNDISIDDCRAHTEERSRAGIKPGTIATELGHLRMVLRWAEKRGFLDRASNIERPTPPKRKDIHLTRAECRTLIDSATMPHIRLYTILALATGARNAAMLELTWDRCDFDREMIDLRNSEISRPHKGRAIVPMNRAAKAALLEMKPAARSDRVIEWAGRPVKSVKRGLKSSADAAEIKMQISPHLLRHSAAVHMAEAGIPIDEIAQFLGHENAEITRRVYARYSPTYLRKAAAVLEYDDLSASNNVMRS